MDHFDVSLANGDSVRVPVKTLLCRERSPFQEIVICDTERFGRCLLLDGVIQTAESDHDLYDQAILARLRPTDRRLLILGGGDGYVAAQALQLNPHVHITIVELDGAVVDLCRRYLGQTIYEHAQVRLVVGDALAFFGNSSGTTFDGVVCDLTELPLGHEGPHATFDRELFLRARVILNSRGWLSAYVGCGGEDEPDNALLVARTLNAGYAGVVARKIFLPSFFEAAFFVGGTAKRVASVQTVSVLGNYEPAVFPALMTILAAAQVDGLNDWDAEYLRERLEDRRSIHVLLHERDRVVGYLMAIPHNEAIEELADADSVMGRDENRYYVNLIEILPGSRRRGGFLRLLDALFREAEEKFGVNRFSMHVRVDTGLSRTVTYLFSRMITGRRRIERYRYYDGNEPCDYLEATYDRALLR